MLFYIEDMDDRLDTGNVQNTDASGFLVDFLAGIPVGAYQIDNQGNFLYCSQEAANILGYDSPEELMKKNVNEDYGVGILHEEINSDKIFEYGYQGKFSYDRSRTGSGIGLAHGGYIKVISIPVDDLGERITHNTPHKTAISIVLPKRQKRR